MYSAIDVACYFLCLQDENAGDLISNLKLQKLLYYAQGFHLALYDTPLFKETVSAWQHGPVVPEAYHTFKDYGSNPIPPPGDIDWDFDIDSFDYETKNLLQEVYEVYGQFSAWKLRNMTHDESPWKDTSLNETISAKAMRDYFKTQLED